RIGDVRPRDGPFERYAGEALGRGEGDADGHAGRGLSSMRERLSSIRERLEGHTVAEADGGPRQVDQPDPWYDSLPDFAAKGQACRLQVEADVDDPPLEPPPHVAVPDAVAEGEVEPGREGAPGRLGGEGVEVDGEPGRLPGVVARGVAGAAGGPVAPLELDGVEGGHVRLRHDEARPDGVGPEVGRGEADAPVEAVEHLVVEHAREGRRPAEEGGGPGLVAGPAVGAGPDPRL